MLWYHMYSRLSTFPCVSGYLTALVCCSFGHKSSKQIISFLLGFSLTPLACLYDRVLLMTSVRFGLSRQVMKLQMAQNKHVLDLRKRKAIREYYYSSCLLAQGGISWHLAQKKINLHTHNARAWWLTSSRPYSNRTDTGGITGNGWC